MTPIVIRSIQRTAILSTIALLAAMLIAFAFDDVRNGWSFLAGCVFGAVSGAIVHWFAARDGWFA